MDTYLDRCHSAGDGMDEISMGQIRNQLSNEELTYENLFDKVIEAERRTGRLVVFKSVTHECCHFPRIYCSGGDRVTLHVDIYLNKDDQTDSRHTHLLRQVGIAVVLSCSVLGLVDNLDADESYDSFAQKYKDHSDAADEFYALFEEKFNKSTI